jgi:hypothetical protein
MMLGGATSAQGAVRALIYVSGFFRNQNVEGISATLRDFVPFAYMNDALEEVFGLPSGSVPLEYSSARASSPLSGLWASA